VQTSGGDRISSGGQTGGDRVGLDFAIAHGTPRVGWCPKGRRAEDGVIRGRHVLQRTPSREYSQRTEWKVRNSDATVIFTVWPDPTGGSKLTADCATKHGKPWLHFARVAAGDPAARLREFLAAHAVKVLNVAGARASKEPEVAAFTTAILTDFFGGVLARESRLSARGLIRVGAFRSLRSSLRAPLFASGPPQLAAEPSASLKPRELRQRRRPSSPQD
jgi:hypothetical protein